MKYIIWDLDGTLIDSKEDIEKSLVSALEISGLDITKQVKPFVIGPTIETVIREAFPREILSDEVVAETIKAFRVIYDNSDYERTKAYEGLAEVIANTEVFEHHIVTNKPDLPTNRILQKLGWGGYITSVTTPYTAGAVLRSKSEIFGEIIKKRENAEFIGIGDTKADCLAAHDNEITAIGVLWGVGTRNELEECCDYLFENSKQLCDFLLK